MSAQHRLLILGTVLFALMLPLPGRSHGGHDYSWDIAAVDALLATVAPEQKLVQVDDMRISVERLRAWRARVGGGVVRASAFDGVAATWPGGDVYYTFDASVSAAKQKAFLDGAAEWGMFANVRFIPRTSETDYVTIRELPGLGGGQSALGRVGGQQVMDFGPGAWSRWVICHEIGHTLGLIHEHQRSDRDGFVTILTANILPGQAVAFARLGDSIHYGAYDFLSVMHYRRDAFSISPGVLNTIEPLPAYAEFLERMGQEYDQVLSAGDRAGMAARYGAGPALTSGVTNTLDSGPGSLRAALYYALDHPGTTITFDIPASDPGFAGDVYTIQPTDNLPGLLHATFLDGSSQPGDANPSGPDIVLNGALCDPVSVTSDGLRMTGTNCVVKSLVINGFPGAGIVIDGPGARGNAVRGCYLGVDPTGTAAVTNRSEALVISGGASFNTIGGTNAAARNILSGSPTDGMVIRGAGTRGNIVAGNYIGLNAAGTAALPNERAGLILYGGAQDNIIGGTAPGSANVISGNLYEGLGIADAGTTGNAILGNLIGLNAEGTAAVPNRWQGVALFKGATSNTVGGAVAAARNVISGNAQQGLILAEPGTRGNLVAGNYIGLNAAGTAAVPNGWSGVQFYGGSQMNTLGGTGAGARNVISGNSFQGVQIVGTNTSGNVVAGNYIGVSPAGDAPLANGWSGIDILGGASANLIGGQNPGSRNVISANGSYGVYIAEVGTDGNVVAGNYIGLDASGSAPLGNAWAGLAVTRGARGNLLGGAAAHEGNVISGNLNYGVNLADPGTTDNRVEGNRIGTDATGALPLANGWDGLALNGGASRNVIGLDTHGSGAGNTLAFNQLTGIRLFDLNTTGNTIRGNAIHANGLIGIDLFSFADFFTGVTPNDVNDIDAGPNELQNYPDLSGAVAHDPVTIISGQLNSTPGRSFLVDLYRTTGMAPSGHGDAHAWIASEVVTTDGDGNGNFALNLPENLEGQFVTATATDMASGDTSEFSATLQTITGAPSPAFATGGALTSSGWVANLSLTIDQSYRVQATTNLVGNPVAWMEVTNFVATGTNVLFIDRSVTNPGSRFYRIISP